jgi:hypothetical protein
MNMYNKILALCFSMTPILIAGCADDNEGFSDPGTTDVTTNPGVISQKNFSILASEVQPTVIDPTTGIFTKTDVTLTVFVGDRDNQTVTDGHTVLFMSEYGLINPPSCETGAEGTCEVTWSAIKRPDPGGPGDDMAVTITAYATGEEAFTDTNGNSVYDDTDAGFEDLEEPYVDVDENDMYNAGDTIIDVVSTNDPTGANGLHDLADGFFNGGGCTHTSLCGARTSITVWDDITLTITGPPAP